VCGRHLLLSPLQCSCHFLHCPCFNGYLGTAQIRITGKAESHSHVRYRNIARGCRPVESHSEAQETIIAGPNHIYNLIPYGPRSRRQRHREGRKRGRGVPSPSHYAYEGAYSKLPGGVRGSAENGFYTYLRSERRHLQHPFQYF